MSDGKIVFAPPSDSMVRDVRWGLDVIGELHGMADNPRSPHRPTRYVFIPRARWRPQFPHMTYTRLEEARTALTYQGAMGVRVTEDGRMHKATPAQSDEYHCRFCGQLIKRVFGGQAPTWIHTETGAVAAPNPPAN